MLARSRTKFAAEPMPPLTVKGKARPVVAQRVGEPLGGRDESVADAPLVDRLAEMATLSDALRAARDGAGQAIELVGDPGIGKSRLLEELANRARDLARVRVRFSVQHAGVPYAAMRPALRTLAAIPEDADEGGAGPPLQAFVGQVAPRLLPWLPLIAIPFGAHAEPTPQADRVSEAFRRDRMHDAVHALLSATLDSPALFVLEDAHLADEASLALCRRIADAPDRPWLVAASRRPYGQPAVPDTATRLTLRPLPPADVALLATAIADRALPDDALAAIARRSGGNPLAIAELAREVASGGSAGELPDSVEALVAARLDSLEADDARLLRVASVLGRRFELDVLRELVDGDSIDVDDLARWKRLSEFVVWEGMDELAFRHDVYVDTAYAGLSYRRRRALHARAAEALETRKAEGLPVDHGVLALHFQHGGRHAEAWRAARLAGEAARAAYASAEACDAFALALEAGRAAGVPAGELAEVAEALGDVGELAGRYPVASDGYREAAALRRDEPVASARLMRKRGVLREREGRYPDALRWYGRALGAIDGLGDDPDAARERVALELAYAGVRFRQGRYQESVRYAERVAAETEAGGDELSLAHALFLLDNAYTDLGRPFSGELSARAAEIYERHGDDANLGKALNNMGIAAYYAGRWDEAHALYRRSREAKERAGDVVRAATGANNEAEILLEQGHLDQAEALLREALRVWSAAGYQLGTALATSNLGRLQALAGRLAEAAALLDEARERFDAIGARGFVLETDARRAELLLLAGDPSGAGRLARRTRERLHAEGGVQVLQASLGRIEALALVAEQRAAEAGPVIASGIDVARALDARYELGLSLLVQASVERALGRDGAAAEAEASATLDGLGLVSLPVTSASWPGR